MTGKLSEIVTRLKPTLPKLTTAAAIGVASCAVTGAILNYAGPEIYELLEPEHYSSIPLKTVAETIEVIILGASAPTIIGSAIGYLNHDKIVKSLKKVSEIASSYAIDAIERLVVGNETNAILEPDTMVNSYRHPNTKIPWYHHRSEPKKNAKIFNSLVL